MLGRSGKCHLDAVARNFLPHNTWSTRVACPDALLLPPHDSWRSLQVHLPFSALVPAECHKAKNLVVKAGVPTATGLAVKMLQARKPAVPPIHLHRAENVCFSVHFEASYPANPHSFAGSGRSSRRAAERTLG